jgi:hypothetical protein
VFPTSWPLASHGTVGSAGAIASVRHCDRVDGRPGRRDIVGQMPRGRLEMEQNHPVLREPIGSQPPRLLAVAQAPTDLDARAASDQRIDDIREIRTVRENWIGQIFKERFRSVREERDAVHLRWLSEFKPRELRKNELMGFRFEQEPSNRLRKNERLHFLSGSIECRIQCLSPRGWQFKTRCRQHNAFWLQLRNTDVSMEIK